MFIRSRRRGRLLSPHPFSRRIYWTGAALLTGLAVVPGYFAVTLPWQRAAPFDVLGILWLMQNAGRLVAIALAAALGGGAIYFTIRGALRR